MAAVGRLLDRNHSLHAVGPYDRMAQVSEANESAYRGSLAFVCTVEELRQLCEDLMR